MALNFRPYPFREDQYSGRDTAETISSGLKSLGDTFSEYGEHKRMRSREEMDRQRLEDDRRLQTLKLAMDEGLDPSVIDEYLNNPNAGRAPKRILSPMQNPRPLLSSNRLNLPADFQSSPDVPSFPMGTKRIQAQEDRDLSRRNTESLIRERETGGGSIGSWSYAGVDEAGNPIQMNSKTGEFRVAQIPGGGRLNPKTDPSASTEATKRTGLVNGTRVSVRSARQLLTPGILQEIKGIKMTPGKIYSQLASREAKAFYRNLSNAIANELYIKSGATATPNEIEAKMIMYMPALNDDVPDVQSRLDQLEDEVGFFDSSKSGGSGLDEMVNRRIKFNESRGSGGDGKAKTVTQGEYTYTLNEETGEYE